jgi:hypothetical protein
MQRGSQYRETEKINLQELYKNRPPRLTRTERSNFEFGAIDVDHFIAELTPVIRQFSKAGFRKPKDVARLLNKKGLLTASGARWTPRLAYFLLSIIFDGRIQKQTDQSGKRLQLQIRPDLKSKQSPIDQSIATTVARSPLTSAELARRLEVLDRVKLVQK